MYSKNLILSAVKGSFSIISKNKRMFLLIFVLQLLFFASIGTVSSFYMSKILQNTMNILEYTESLNLDPQTASIDILGKRSPLGDNPLLIGNNYSEITRNFGYLLFFGLVLFVLLNGSVWYFASTISAKKNKLVKELLPYLSKFIIMSIILAAFLYLLAYNALQAFFSSYLLTEPSRFMPVLLFGIIAPYFIYIAIPLLNRTDFRNLAKKVFLLGTKNFFTILTSYLIILIAIILFAMLAFYSIEKNIFLIQIFLILLVGVFAWSKVFLSVVVQGLTQR